MYPILQSVLFSCYILLLSAKNSLTFVSNETNSSEVILNRCKDFVWDYWDSYENSSLPIPGIVTFDRKNTHFRLQENEEELECTDSVEDVILLTTKSVDTNITITNSSNMENKVVSSNDPAQMKQISKLVKMRGQIFDHFTKEGFLMINSVYYEPRRYCIANFARSTIGVKICKNNCATQKKTASPGCVNIPKCCGLNQELVFWNFTCQNSQKNIWAPAFYSDPHTRLSKEANPEVKYWRPSLKCANWEPWPNSEVIRPRKNKGLPHPKLNWRLLSDGSIVYLNKEDRWIPILKGDFCMDGFANWGLGGDGDYSGKEKDQVIILCPGELQPPDATIAYLYASFLFVSSLFLLLTVIVHVALYEKLQVHGLTVMSHSASMFLMYIFLGLAYFTSARAIENQDSFIKIGSNSCIAIGILAHFFFFATFSWLTIMNADLWWTFRTVKPMGNLSQRMIRFRIYSGIGWGIPVALISTFVGLDYSKRYYANESISITPDYGVKSCFVNCESRGYYIYCVLAILVGINIIFIVSTSITFIKFQRKNQKFSSKKTANLKLFAKLFFIMGVAWCFELYSWAQNPCNYKVAWHIIILDFVMFFQAAGNFVIFCCNARTVAQLEDKFPQYQQAFKIIKKIICMKSSTSTRDGFDLGNRSQSGGTIRKLSTTISQSLHTDQTS